MANDIKGNDPQKPVAKAPAHPATAPQPQQQDRDAPRTFGAPGDVPGSNADPTKVPDENPGIEVTRAGTQVVPVEQDPDFDPDTVPAVQPNPLPDQPTPFGVTHDSSADTRNVGAVPKLGWVDHDIADSFGNQLPVHSHGVVLIPKQVPMQAPPVAATVGTVPADAEKDAKSKK